MSLHKHLLVVVLILSAQIFCTAQIEVSSGALPPYDPQTLIEEVLLGEGVEILNIQYDGPDKAVGYFNSATTNIGLEEGIVLTTGVAASEGANIGIVEPGNMEASANNQSTATDPDIELLAEGEDIFNLTKYTITFVPSSDRLSFRYVFASEEYPEFGCTPYNDFFGFFISGPGFSGVYENGGENIALIPGTNQAVAINNIHPQNPTNPACTPVFPEFYNDNNGTGDFPVYDGYLDIFTAEAEVVPCETYTIKLVIADISDAQRDSGVFFEAKSFNSQGFQVSANSQALDGTLIEGCTEGEFNITIEDAEATDLMIDYQMVGDAINGVDYETISGTISIPAGQTSVSIPVIPIVDSNIENVESIGLDIQINNCTRDTFFLYLRDPELETPDLGDDQVICGNASVDLDGTISATSQNGANFSSSSAPVLILGPIGSNPPVPAYMNIEVSGFNPPQLRDGLINQVCINFGHSAPEDLDIYLYAPGGQFMLLSSDNGAGGSDYTNTCFSPTETNSIINGAAPFTGTFAAEGNWETLWFGDSPVNGTWRLMAIDDESGFTGTIQNWSIEFNSTFEIEYSWSPTTDLTCSDCPNPTASPSTTTEYTLTVSDSYGCQTSDDVTITLIDSYAAPVISCTNASTTSVTFTWDPIPNADNYEVNVNNDGWFPLNNPPLSHTVNGLNTGEMVSIEVRATGSCPANIGTQTCQTIDCSGFTTMQNSTAVSCIGEDDGTISLSANSANSGIEYTLDDDTNTTGMFTGLTAGMYTVLVSDDAGCSENVQVEVTEPIALTSNIALNNNIDCNNDTASATATGGGGDNSFTYAWSNGDMGANLTALTVDEYFVTITDGNMCETVDSINIISEGSLEATITSNVICAGATDGTATVTVTVGTEPIEYQWDSNASSQMTATATDLIPGEYFVTVTSADDCELVLSTTITTNPEMTLIPSFTDASCGNEDGTASVSVMGGTADFEYLWSTTPAQMMPTATGLAAGEYFVTVTDANLCTSVTSVVVTTPSSINLLSLVANDASCFGEENGTLTANADGGTAPLTYTVGLTAPQPTGDFTGLGVGDYNLVITDAMGCSSSFPFTIDAPTEIETTPISIQVIDCQNPMGSATVSVTGGSLPYSFAWSNMSADSILTTNITGEYYVTVTDGLGCMTLDTVQINEADVLSMNTGAMSACNGETTGFAYVEVATGTAPFIYQWDANAGNAMTDTVFNLAPGMYSVTVTDAGNCELIETITVDEFPVIILSTSTTEADCNGTPDGTATVTIMGGTADFTYLWSDATAQTTATASNLSAGLYTVTVTDANGCTMTADANISTPSMLSIGGITATNVTCYDGTDGTATVTATGGTGDFTFAWSDAAMQNTTTATNLSPAEYTVTVSDEMGCQVTASVELENAEEILLDFATVDVLCASDIDGSIDLTILSGGNPNFTYAWNNMETTEDLNNLSAGIYMVTVTDADMCTATGEATINTTAPITVTSTTEDATCYNYEDASISVEVVGGVEPYTYDWATGETTDNLEDIAAGTYELTVTDANNCGVLSTIEITQPEIFTATFETIEPLCAGDETGSLTITPIGGQADYLYSIDGIIYTESPVFENIAAQSYHVFVQDGNECLFDSTNVLVAEPQLLRVDAGEDITTEIGERVFLEALIAGGTGEIDFTWEVPTGIELSCEDCFAPFAMADDSGYLTVTVMDENNCIATDDILIRVKKDYKMFIPNVFSPNLDGKNDIFMPYGKSNTFIKSMQIFDRWGDLVYAGGDFFVNGAEGWNGKVKGKFVETGVYVYSIEAIFVDGESVLFKGDVTVLR